MPTVDVDDTLAMYYEDDSFVEPWREPEVVLLLHGVGGSTEEWYAWMPALTAEYRVLRVDLRGWGRSTVPPADYPWSMDAYADDVAAFLDAIGVDRVHLLGTKLGGRIGLHIADRHPERLRSLTLVCTPMTIKFGDDDHGQRLPRQTDGQDGLARWARRTMPERLGAVPDAMREWWIGLYERCSPRVMDEVLSMAFHAEEYGILPRVCVPTLVIDSDAEASIESIVAWQSTIPDSRFHRVLLTDEGRQISASKPDECARAFLDFLHEQTPARA